MESRLTEILSLSRLEPMRSRDWVPRLIRLLDAAAVQLDPGQHVARSALREAASLLRQQIAPQVAEPVPDGRGRLLAWQARKVRAYIDAHISGPVRIADLCGLIQRSEAHFSRSFRRTFGESPHAFVIRRRLDLAVQYMLHSDASLSDISLQCGFTDQAHLCKHFRQLTGETPAAWRRAHQARRESGSAAAAAASEKPRARGGGSGSCGDSGGRQLGFRKAGFARRIAIDGEASSGIPG